MRFTTRRRMNADDQTSKLRDFKIGATKKWFVFFQGRGRGLWLARPYEQKDELYNGRGTSYLMELKITDSDGRLTESKEIRESRKKIEVRKR